MLLAAVLCLALMPFSRAFAGPAQEFTLAVRSGGPAWTSAPPRVPPFSLGSALPLRDGKEAGWAAVPIRPAAEPAPGTIDRKRPWLAGLENISINLGVWAFNRYVLKEDWAYISWESIKANFRNGFEYDDDGFFTNFFMHPYHGSLYYNASRSLGMTYLESSLFNLGGSLIWEMFFENQYPSTNDLIMTATGGGYFGEVFHRMSSLILDDTATGAERTWREILAFVINPMRGLNRVFFGETRLRSDVNRQIRAPIKGHLAITSSHVVKRSEFSGPAPSFSVELDFIYGERFLRLPKRTPFDMIVFNTGVRQGNGTYFHIDTYALIWGKESESSKGRGQLFGLFQNYDFLRNEEIEIGGTSVAGGVISFLPFGADGKLDLRTTAQAGAMIFGASDNRYKLLGTSDYHYGLGPMLKFESRLTHTRWGWLSLRFNHYQNYAHRARNSAEGRSHDFFTLLKAQYGVAVRRGVGFRVEHASFLRRTFYEGNAPINSTLSHLSFSLILSFK